HRELATPLQHDQAARLNRIQATSTRGVHARIRRVAGCATPTGFAGHAGATANLELTFHLDHSAGADHFLLALAADFKQHGASVIAKVRKQQPAAYMKICALLVPREMKVEHAGGVKAMSDEQITAAIEAIEGWLAARSAGDNAKVIEGVAERMPSARRSS